VVVTALLFGPVSGFHHMFWFGVYMMVDCDSPPEDLPIPFGRCGISVSWIALAVTIALWLSLVLTATLLLRRRSARGVSRWRAARSLP
jgi:hypothetical protein